MPCPCQVYILHHMPKSDVSHDVPVDSMVMDATIRLCCCNSSSYSHAKLLEDYLTLAKLLVGKGEGPMLLV